MNIGCTCAVWEPSPESRSAGARGATRRSVSGIVIEVRLLVLLRNPDRVHETDKGRPAGNASLIDLCERRGGYNTTITLPPEEIRDGCNRYQAGCQRMLESHIHDVDGTQAALWGQALVGPREGRLRGVA